MNKHIFIGRRNCIDIKKGYNSPEMFKTKIRMIYFRKNEKEWYFIINIFGHSILLYSKFKKL